MAYTKMFVIAVFGVPLALLVFVFWIAFAHDFISTSPWVACAPAWVILFLAFRWCLKQDVKR